MNEIEEDISKNTTLQYRAPEMVDLYMQKEINEKVDIWVFFFSMKKIYF